MCMTPINRPLFHAHIDDFSTSPVITGLATTMEAQLRNDGVMSENGQDHWSEAKHQSAMTKPSEPSGTCLWLPVLDYHGGFSRIHMTAWSTLLKEDSSRAMHNMIPAACLTSFKLNACPRKDKKGQQMGATSSKNEHLTAPSTARPLRISQETHQL